MNVKNRLLAIALLGLVAVLGAACSGNGGPTPTRTPKAVAENIATQTPWIIYVPVTTTPEPFTVTPLPTVTSSQPQQPTAAPVQPTRTRAAQPTNTRTIQRTAVPTDSPTPAQPTATPAPACGQTYQVTRLTFPADAATRDVKTGGGASKTVQFKWDPVSPNELDPKIGYQIVVSAPKNSTAIYISHNGYLKVMSGNGAILSQQAAYGLTNGDDTVVKWNVTVVLSSGGFDDQNFGILGVPTACGPASPSFNLTLRVVQ